MKSKIDDKFFAPIHPADLVDGNLYKFIYENSRLTVVGLKTRDGFLILYAEPGVADTVGYHWEKEFNPDSVFSGNFYLFTGTLNLSN